MVLDWNNPIGLGLFFLMVAGTVTVASAGAWLAVKAVSTLKRR